MNSFVLAGFALIVVAGALFLLQSALPDRVLVQELYGRTIGNILNGVAGCCSVLGGALIAIGVIS